MMPLRFLVPVILAGSLHAADIVGHRGASHDAPENTLASEKLAWKQGADVVEDDIYLTKDGKIIVSHDKTTKRTTGVDLSIPDTTFDELRKLDAGKWKGAQFAGEKLPTLDEQIALIPPGKRMFVEIKIGPEIVPELKRTLERMKAGPDKITIISFNYESLKECRKQLPGYKTQYLVGHPAPGAKTPPKKKQPTLDEIIAEATSAKLTGLDLQNTWNLTKEEAKKIKDAGLELHVWTVDDPEIARHWLFDLGALSVTTNRPGFIREQLKL